jgi:hypothetical protein
MFTDIRGNLLLQATLKMEAAGSSERLSTDYTASLLEDSIFVTAVRIPNNNVINLKVR